MLLLWLIFVLLEVDATLDDECRTWEIRLENHNLRCGFKIQVIVILKAIFQNWNYDKPYFIIIDCFRHFDVRRTPDISLSRGCNQLLYDSAWSSHTLCKVPFSQESFAQFQEVKCVQGNSKTLRVGIWNFKSHSHFLKVWCNGYIPGFLNRLLKIYPYFISIFNSFLFSIYIFLWRLSSNLTFCFVYWGY